MLSDEQLARREAELIELNKALDEDKYLFLNEEDTYKQVENSGPSSRQSRNDRFSGMDKPEAQLSENEGPRYNSQKGSGRGGSNVRPSRIPRATRKASPGSAKKSGNSGNTRETSVERSELVDQDSPSPQQKRTGSLPDIPLKHPEAEQEDEEAALNLGPEGTIRFQRARIKVLETQMKELSRRCQELDMELSGAQAETRSHLEEKKKLAKELQAATLATKKQMQQQEKVESSTGSLQQKISALKDELNEANRKNKQSEERSKTLELRLNRALEDVEKYKSGMQQAKSSVKDTSAQQIQQSKELEARCQRLERQKVELLNAFKKQMRLIDILKRQKVHIEAARLLAFTEEEFMKILDWGT